ncbi:MAG: hypothetical protein MRZ17_03060 [Acholeplasmataceae bacterium]|nr:hypothetical protein [Acholeplasmataceae bacterium]
MKKILYVVFALLLMFTLVGCNSNDDPKIEGALTYEEYMKKEANTEVTVVAYVQAKQSWWEEEGQGKASIYAQDKDGGYFFYNLKCTKEEYEKLTVGTRIKVTGNKAVWSGEVEIMDGTFEIVKGKYVAETLDVTALLGTEELIKHQNKLVSFKGMTVEAKKDAEGKDVAFLYKWNGSGEEGDDLYFDVSLNGTKYTFTVESYLCDKDSDVYKAVKNLKVGDKIDMEGFLYWYNGVNPHITKVTINNDPVVQGALTYEEYMKKEANTEVTVVAYVQAKQAWWEEEGQGKASIYAQDKDGGYFFYNLKCTKAEYEKLTVGTRIKVTGNKAVWSGEVEIMDGTFEIVEGKYVACVLDVTALLGTEELIKHQNKLVSFKGMTVEAKYKPADAEDPNPYSFLYKWNGSGEEGDDLYFDVSLNGTKYTFTVESYLCDKDSDVYKAVKNLKIGDKIDMEGFLYWYNGVNPHITKVTVVK